MAKSLIDECLASITHENIVADLSKRGARPEAEEYVADILLCVRKRLRALDPNKDND